MSSITYVEVEQAIEALLKQKRSLTLAHLRHQLGDRGSMTTLSKYFQQWKSSRFLEGMPSQTIVEPAPDSILSAVQTVWHQMIDHGQEQLSQQQILFEDKEKLFNETIVTLEEKITLLTQELKNNERLNAELEARCQLRDEEYEGLQKKHLELTALYHHQQAALTQKTEEYRLMVLDLEKNYVLRLKEITDFYEEHKQASILQNADLKLLMEQQRHDSIATIDRLTLENKQLLAAYQEQNLKLNLSTEVSVLTDKILQKIETTAVQQEQAVASLIHHYETLVLNQQKKMSFETALMLPFYQKSRNIFS
jgi:hypothetical protein